jgi:phage terminase large subunit-like protein
MFCLRLGSSPKVIITTTPRPKKLIFDLIKRSDIHLTRGTTFDNANNLPKNFMNMIAQQYGNTQLGQQEIEGELLLCDSSALWNYLDFEYGDNQLFENLNTHEIVIAIDPAMTAKEGSDETGIIVASKHKGCYYVLEDASGIMKPEIWAHKAYELYNKYQAKKVIVEINQGGQVLLAMLNSFANVPWEGVRAKESKYKRAIPISSLYQQKKVVHATKFEKLEEQLIKAHLNFADDRLDALVWALYHLMQIKNSSNSFACW